MMSLLDMSLQGACMIGVTLLIRRVARNRLPIGAILALWAICLARLLLPVSLPSSASLYAHIPANAPTARPLPGARTAEIPAGTMATPSASFSPRPPPHEASPNETWIMVWLAGLLVCVGAFIWLYVRSLRQFREAVPATGPSLNAWRQAHPLRRPLAIRIWSGTDTPLTYGIFRPVILLPAREMADLASLLLALEHEYTHIRRLDSLTKIILASAACVHWFNPLVWCMYILMNRDLEIACDAATVRRLGTGSRAFYARTLIELEADRADTGALPVAFGRPPIEERIRAIMKLKKTSLLAILVSTLLVVGVTVALGTSAPSESQPSSPMVTATDMDQLKTLHWDGYQTMTIADYQEKIWRTLDENPDLAALCEQYAQTQPEAPQGEAFAKYFCGTLEPLTAEQWGTQEFSGGWTGNQVEGAKYTDPARAEYVCIVELHDPHSVTVAQYEMAKTAFDDAFITFFEERTLAELRDADTIRATLDAMLAALEQRWVTEGMSISMDVQYIPPMEDAHMDQWAAYAQLMSFRPDGYENMSVDEFNALLEKDYPAFDAAYEVVFASIRPQDEAYDFVTTTLGASVDEIYKQHIEKSTDYHIEDRVMRQMQPKPALGADTEPVYDKAVYGWYDVLYTMPDPSKVTVAERDAAIRSMREGLQEWVDTLSDKEILTEDFLERLAAKVEELAADASTDDIHLSRADAPITVETVGGEDEKDADENEGDWIEDEEEDWDEDGQPREPGTAGDYKALLRLKTNEYRDQTLSDFNQSLLDWGNEDPARMERISVDTALNDFAAPLDEDEKRFVALTVSLSGTENGRLVQSLHTGRQMLDPRFNRQMPERTEQRGNRTIWADLFFQYEYHVEDPAKLTVGERDDAVAGFLAEVDRFWKETPLDGILEMDEVNVTKRLESLAKKSSVRGLSLAVLWDSVTLDRTAIDDLKQS